MRTSCIALAIVSSVRAYFQPPTPKLRTLELGHRYSPNSPSCTEARGLEHVPFTPAVAKHRAPAIASLAVPSLVTAAPAFAAADALPSATAAYAHYLALMGIVGALTTERLLLKEDMNEASFDTLAKADIVYGLSGFLVLFSGYFRATAYGKGWEFYAHEPLFWVKMSLLALVGSAS